MAKYIAVANGNWSNTATWGTGTNTASTHASKTLTITTNYTEKFTAPSTSDDCLGAIFTISTIPTSTYSYTITLQENEVDTAAAVTIAGTELSSYGMFFAKFASAYTFTSTTASYYRFKIVASGSGGTALKMMADSGGTLVSFQAVDDRHPAAAPTTGDDVWIIGGNQTGTVSVTLDGTQLVGTGTDSIGSAISFNQAVYIGTGGLLTWDTAASATLTCKGYISVNGIEANPGELRIGTVASPYPVANTAQLIFDNYGTSGNAGMYNGGYGSSNYGKIQLHGVARPDTTKWKTMLSSGTGTVADPIVLADAVGWATGDEVIVTTTSTCPHAYRADENELATITRVDDSTYSLVGNLDPVNGDFEASDWAGWAKAGTYAIETASVHGGAKAAKITYAAGGSYIYQDFFIKAGAVCTLKFWTRGDGTNQGQYQVYRVNSTAADIVAKKTTGVTSTTWTEVTETFTAPAGCYQVRVYFHQPVAAGDAYFDDVTLTYAGLQYTHTADKAWVLNVTRNVVVKSIGNVEGWGGQTRSYSPFLGLTTTTLDFDWVRFNNLRGPICGNYAAAGASYHSVDYCVFMVPVSNNFSGIMGWTRHNSYGVEKSETLTGNIAYKGGAATAVYNMSAFNKNLVDCFAIQVNGSACSSFRSAGECTMTRCISLSQYTMDTGGGFHLAGTGIKCIDCEVQSIYKQPIYVESPSVAIFTRQLHGTKASANTIYPGDILSPSYSDLTFRDCTFQFAFPHGTRNTLADSTPSSVWKIQNSGGLGTNVDFVMKQMGYLYRTGPSLTDTTAHTSGGYALRFQPTTSTTALPWTFTVSTGNIQTYETTISVWVKINNAAYYAGTHQNPTLRIDYDNGTVVTDVATDTTDWQLLTKAFTPTTTFGQVTITIDGYTDATTTDAYFYVDDFDIAYPSGYAVNLGKLDVWADGSPITPSSDTTGYLSYDWTQDPYVVHTESQANALTGIALNYTLKTMAVTESHSITELYEYCKASARTAGVVQAFSTKDGITYKLSGGWTMTIGEIDITGTPFLDLNGTVLDFPTAASMTPTLRNGSIVLTDAGTISCNMTGISIDYQGAGTFNHSNSTTSGTITVDTTTEDTVLAQFAPGTTVTNLDEVNITVENAATVDITVNNIIAGSRIQIYDTDSDTEMYNEVVAGTSFTDSITYTGDINVRIRLMYVDGVNAYKWYTATATIASTGFSVNAAQEVNSVYEANNIDGSTVTECSVSGSTIRVYVDDPDNTTSAQRIYNWYQYYLFTEAGIEEQDGTYITATDQTHYIFVDTMKIINSDTANPLNITGANIVPTTGAATNIFDLTNGASIALNFNRVEGFAYSSGSGLSTEEHDTLMGIDTVVDTNLDAKVSSISSSKPTLLIDGEIIV